MFAEDRPSFLKKIDKELDKLKRVSEDYDSSSDSDRNEKQEPNELGNISEDSNSDSDIDEKQEHGSIGSLQMQSFKIKTLQASQELLLSICYTGLCWLEEPMLLSDLIR